jgi:hypothetical protein
MYDSTTIPLCKRTVVAANSANPVKQSHRKRFRFAPEISQVVDTGLSRDDFTEEETSNYWWSREKSHTLRSAACLIIETARANKDDDMMIHLIDDSYKFAKDATGCLKVDAIEDILQDPSLHSRLLEVWYTKEQDACGLEPMISQLQKLERRADYACLLRYVVNMSETTRTVEEIAEIAIRISLTSRVYARMVGHAEANILYSSRRKAVRCHTMVAPLESKTSRITCTRKSLPPPKRSAWRRLTGRGKAVTADV